MTRALGAVRRAWWVRARGTTAGRAWKMAIPGTKTMTESLIFTSSYFSVKGAMLSSLLLRSRNSLH